MTKFLLAMGVFVLLIGCKDVGDSCEVTGDGFQRRDPCAEMCIDFEITCPNGRVTTPGECTGDTCSGDGDCAEGQICLQIDSFADNSRCMRAAVCQ